MIVEKEETKSRKSQSGRRGGQIKKEGKKKKDGREYEKERGDKKEMILVEKLSFKIESEVAEGRGQGFSFFTQDNNNYKMRILEAYAESCK